MTSSHGRTAVNVLLALALLGAAFSGLAARWFAVDFHFFGEVADADDYRTGAVSVVVAALAIAVLGSFVLAVLDSPPWVWVLLAVVVGGELVLAGTTWASAAGAEVDDYPSGPFESVPVVALCPTSWPLLAFVLVAGLKLVSRPRTTSLVDA